MKIKKYFKISYNNEAAYAIYEKTKHEQFDFKYVKCSPDRDVWLTYLYKDDINEPNIRCIPLTDKEAFIELI